MRIHALNRWIASTGWSHSWHNRRATLAIRKGACEQRKRGKQFLSLSSYLDLFPFLENVVVHHVRLSTTVICFCRGSRLSRSYVATPFTGGGRHSAGNQHL